MSTARHSGQRGPAGAPGERLWPLGAALAAAFVVGACSTAAPPRFHSLMPAPQATTGGPAAAAAKIVPAGALAWEVLPVSVPPGVDQPQWVLRSVDGSLVVLEQERWMGPLGEEIRGAVVAQLTQALGAPAAKASTLWRVRIEVQRFESAPGREARVDVTWSIAPDAGAMASALRCRGEFLQAPASEGYLALAAAHQQAISRMTEAIASGLKAIAAGGPATCGA